MKEKINQKKKYQKKVERNKKPSAKKKCRFKKYISTVQTNIDKKNVINL